MHSILAALWFLLPGGIANMAPIAFNRLPILNVPVDFGRNFHGQPIFGPHKTYRGFLVGIICAVAFVYLQRVLYGHTASFSLVDYSTTNFVTLGFWLGFGALTGDLVKSFFKRRVGRRSGQSWVPFDQIDWVAGSIIFAGIVHWLNLGQIIWALLIFGLAHPLSNLLGYYLRFKPNKF